MSTQNVYDVGSNGSVFASEQSYTLVILDSENLINREIRIDFTKLDSIVKRYSKNTNIIKIAVVHFDTNNKHSSLVKALYNYNYNVIVTQNNCDVIITSLLFEYCNKYNIQNIFICTRDGDFAFAINIIKQLYNINVYLITTIANKFNVKIASQLVNACDQVIFIENLKLQANKNDIAKLYELQTLAKQLKSKYKQNEINMLISYLLS